MATLKISELSVGDWVRYDDRICQIAEIYHLTYNIGSKKMTSFPRVTLYYEDDMPTYQESVILKDIHPIPITAEMLERKGLFRHERDDKNSELIVLSNHFIMARTYTDVDWWRVLIYDEELPSRELFNGRIYSVHQLQHALRLAGVDKEINLSTT